VQQSGSLIVLPILKDFRKINTKINMSIKRVRFYRARRKNAFSVFLIIKSARRLAIAGGSAAVVGQDFPAAAPKDMTESCAFLDRPAPRFALNG
jgi:hypothetical protein